MCPAVQVPAPFGLIGTEPRYPAVANPDKSMQAAVLVAFTSHVYVLQPVVSVPIMYTVPVVALLMPVH